MESQRASPTSAQRMRRKYTIKRSGAIPQVVLFRCPGIAQLVLTRFGAPRSCKRLFCVSAKPSILQTVLCRRAAIILEVEVIFLSARGDHPWGVFESYFDTPRSSHMSCCFFWQAQSVFFFGHRSQMSGREPLMRNEGSVVPLMCVSSVHSNFFFLVDNCTERSSVWA